MKKYLLILLIGICLFAMIACSNVSDESATQEAKFIIQYNVDGNTYIIDVTEGMPYAMNKIPEKNGFVFIGLFSADIGGIQYVDAQGVSISPFTDNKNLVLFPQFEPKKYKLILDYGGADVLGEREINISYNATVPTLPTALMLEHRIFCGWYTLSSMQGVQIADKYGVLPDKNILNEDNFDLSNENGFVYLYAGFEMRKYTVTFCFEEGMETEDLQVAYGTHISEVVPRTRVDGHAVLTWSKSQGGTIWKGNIEGEMVLFAIDYAPVIDFDCNGGNNVIPVVASAGSKIKLPVPMRQDYAFIGWYSGDYLYDVTIMPSNSLTLEARWNPMLVFNERGGTFVDNIKLNPGSNVVLPHTEKEGYVFAGWYTENDKLYDSTVMPFDSIRLEARYYKEITKTYIVIQDSTEVSTSIYNPGLDHRFIVDVGSIYKEIIHVKIKGYYKSKHNRNGAVNYLRLQDSSIISSANLVTVFSCNPSTSWKEYSFEQSFELKSNTLYFYYYTSQPNVANEGGHFGRWSDLYIEISYPDISQLY